MFRLSEVRPKTARWRHRIFRNLTMFVYVVSILAGSASFLPVAAASSSAFTFSPSAPLIGSPVSFDGSASVCSASPCTYRWTDDADRSLLGTGVKMSFTFKQKGTKYVRLTVKDARSRSTSVEHDVIVSQGTVSVPTISSFTPSSGLAAASVTINGSNFTGATAVRFNGVTATFTIASSTAIQTVVPAGATTGPLSVTTPAGVATSSASFTVSTSTASPTASFTFSPSSPVAGSAVSFNGSASTCPSTPCSYRWTDETNGSTIGTGATMSFTFTAAGTRSIRLTVTDNLSRTGSVARNVIVSEDTPPGPLTGDFYVAPTGSDSNPGTSASPWKTIQKAANTLNAGQSVIVKAGTYNERVSVTRSGASGNPISFVAQGTAVMQGFNIQASNIQVLGFEITNTPGTSATDRSRGSGVYISGSGNEITGNYVHHTTAAAIYLTSSANNTILSTNRIAYGVECGVYLNGSGNLLENNDISHTRSVSGSDADGVRFFGSGNTVRGNYVHDLLLSDSPGQSPHLDSFQTWGPASNYTFEQNLIDKQAVQAQGFTIEGLTQPVGNIVIRNNVFITRGTGYQPNVNTGDLGLVTNTSIINNTMVAMNGAAEYAVWIFENQRGVVMKNNAIYDHGNSGSPYVQVDSGASGLDIGFNSISKSNGQAPQGSAFSGDLWMVDPQFVNRSGGDFHLKSTSPLINRGTPLSQVTDDYDGVHRPQGSTLDIGGFEFVP